MIYALCFIAGAVTSAIVIFAALKFALSNYKEYNPRKLRGGQCAGADE
jgi:hypothetical protein